MNPGSFLLSAHADNPREGVTLAELRAFLGQCDALDVPDTAYVRARQTKTFHKDGGRLVTLTVDRDEAP